jgi:hypothetical protein
MPGKVTYYKVIMFRILIIYSINQIRNNFSKAYLTKCIKNLMNKNEMPAFPLQAD